MNNIDRKAKIIRKIYELGEEPVLFEHGETICPVCKFFGIIENGSVKVITTRNDVRYCECLHCGTRFKSVSKINSSKILEKMTKTKKICKKKNVSKEKKRK